jgi:hypothetical protein
MTSLAGLITGLCRPLSRHPGLEPGSIWQPLERSSDGSRLKARMTFGVAEEVE